MLQFSRIAMHEIGYFQFQSLVLEVMSYYDTYLKSQFQQKLHEAEEIALALQNLTYDLETENEPVIPYASAFANYSRVADSKTTKLPTAVVCWSKRVIIFNPKMF